MANGESFVDIHADDRLLKADLDRIRRTITAEVSKAEKAATVKVSAGLDPGAAKILAEYDQALQSVAADAARTAVAVQKLGSALGPEMAGRLGSSGLTRAVTDLQRLGLTAEQVADNADQVAASMKRAATATSGLGGKSLTQLDDLENSTRRAADATDGLGVEMKKASVGGNLFGNIVGDATASLGPFGLALGQLTEYSTESLFEGLGRKFGGASTAITATGVATAGAGTAAAASVAPIAASAVALDGQAVAAGTAAVALNAEAAAAGTATAASSVLLPVLVGVAAAVGAAIIAYKVFSGDSTENARVQTEKLSKALAENAQNFVSVADAARASKGVYEDAATSQVLLAEAITSSFDDPRQQRITNSLDVLGLTILDLDAAIKTIDAGPDVFASMFTTVRDEDTRTSLARLVTDIEDIDVALRNLETFGRTGTGSVGTGLFSRAEAEAISANEAIVAQIRALAELKDTADDITRDDVAAQFFSRIATEGDRASRALADQASAWAVLNGVSESGVEAFERFVQLSEAATVETIDFAAAERGRAVALASTGDTLRESNRLMREMSVAVTDVAGQSSLFGEQIARIDFTKISDADLSGLQAQIGGLREATDGWAASVTDKLAPTLSGLAAGLGEEFSLSGLLAGADAALLALEQQTGATQLLIGAGFEATAQTYADIIAEAGPAAGQKFFEDFASLGDDAAKEAADQAVSQFGSKRSALVAQWSTIGETLGATIAPDIYNAVRLALTGSPFRPVIDTNSIAAQLAARTYTVRVDAAFSTAALTRFGSQFRFAGGPVAAGQSVFVNEVGQESFRDMFGRLSMLSGEPFSTFTAPTAGTVLNHVETANVVSRPHVTVVTDAGLLAEIAELRAALERAPAITVHAHTTNPEALGSSVYWAHKKRQGR